MSIQPPTLTKCAKNADDKNKFTKFLTKKKNIVFPVFHILISEEKSSSGGNFKILQSGRPTLRYYTGPQAKHTL